MTELPADWFLLLLRVLFVFLLYFFLYQLFRVQMRQLLSISQSVARHRSGQPMSMGALVVISGTTGTPPEGRRFDLRPTTTIGRHPDNLIHLNEPSISSVHAEIHVTGRGAYVTDLGSTNGTFVNDQRIHGPTSITGGDVVQFGRIRMRVDA